MTRRTAMRFPQAALGLVAALALGGAPARAQTPAADSVALGRVVAHIDAARFDSARAALAGWRSARADAARTAERAFADLLGARLETDGVTAQHAWVALALSHPFGPDAGLALLRVGQATLLQGDTAAARVHLERLIDDFPGSGHAAEAHLWLSRTHSAAARHAAACSAARSGLATPGSAEVIGLLRIQEQVPCAARDPINPAPAGSGGRYAVQAGAFRMRSGADALLARLRSAGFQPRLVRVPTNDLMRVRVGSAGSTAEAAALRDRMRSAGFDAVVVDDAGSEAPVP